MHNIRVSVTDIDSYCWFRGGEQPVEELMRRLLKEEPPNEAMRAGTAFHKALELAQEGSLECLEADGYRFILPLGSDIEISLPTIRELKLEREILINGLTVTLVGKVDALEARTVHDHKTTGEFKPERLMETYQWRFYLDCFDADVFQWNVFETDQAERFTYVIKGFEILRQYRYPGLVQDCHDMLLEFLDFLGVSRMRFPTPECRLADLLRANQ